MGKGRRASLVKGGFKLGSKANAAFLILVTSGISFVILSGSIRQWWVELQMASTNQMGYLHLAYYFHTYLFREPQHIKSIVNVNRT